MPEIISLHHRVKGIAPDTWISPFRYVAPKAIARRTDGDIFPKPNSNVSNSGKAEELSKRHRYYPIFIEWKKFGAVLYGIEYTLRARQEDEGKEIAIIHVDDGRNAGFMVGDRGMKLSFSVIITRPRSVLFVPENAVDNKGNVTYGLVAPMEAGIVVAKRADLKESDPDILIAARKIRQWKPKLEKERENRLEVANKAFEGKLLES